MIVGVQYSKPEEIILGPETSSPGITPIHTGAVEITIQTSMLGRITVPQIEGISGEDILEDFRLQVSITGETEGIATERTLDKIFKKCATWFQ